MLEIKSEIPAPNREIRRLNTLRGVAALLVVTSHYSNASKYHPWLGAGTGVLGVMLFFLLSGFLMAHLYYDQPPSPRNLRNFLAARLARVVPLYYIVVLLSFVLMRFAPPPLYGALYGIRTGPELASHLLFLNGVSVLWSIPPEIQFYLLFAIGWALSKTLRAWMVVPLTSILIADFFLGFPLKIYPLGVLSLGSHLLAALPYFIVGCVFGCGYRRWRYPRLLSHAWILALAIPLLYPSIFAWLHGQTNAAVWSDVGVMATMSAVFYAVVFLVPDGNKLLENKIGDLLGKISYSVYLLHLPILRQFQIHSWIGGYAWLLVFLAAVLIVAWLSFLSIEAPSRRFLRYLWAAPIRKASSSS